MPCRLAKDLNCVFPIWITHGDRALIHTCHAVFRPCRLASDFSRPRHSMCELTTAGSRRPVGHLHSFGFFRLSRGVTRRLFSQRLSATNWTAAEFCQERYRWSLMRRSWLFLGKNTVLVQHFQNTVGTFPLHLWLPCAFPPVRLQDSVEFGHKVTYIFKSSSLDLPYPPTSFMVNL